MNTMILCDHKKTLLKEENLTKHQFSNIYLEFSENWQGRACALELACLGSYPGYATNQFCKLG